MLGQIIEERYLVEAELGEGAMGCVYRARHVKVGRQVAIKVMHAELARVPSIVERFAREARIAARLNHPNLIGVLDVGMTAERLPLIVLELAPGKSLFQTMLGALPRERVVNLTRQLLLGLQHAHAAGLVHRDLKPDNILVETTADGTEVPRIVDFGIAVCHTGEDPIANRRLTEANTVIGTPCYMSPEQAMAKDLDARSDLFSLGVIVYEMLAGMPPFTGTGVDVAIANASKDAPSIAERAGIVVDPLLEAFSRKLMARKLGERFQSARDALIMLDRIEADRIDAARTLSAPAATPLPVSLPSPIAMPDMPTDSDRMATRPVTAITRVEQISNLRPSRRRRTAGIALAFAALTAIAGWSFHGSSTQSQASVASAPVLTAQSATVDVELAPTPATAPVVTESTFAAGQLVATASAVASAPAVASASVVPAAPAGALAARAAHTVKPAPRAKVQHTVIAATREEAPAMVVHNTILDTSSAVAARYMEIGRALRGSSDELWARYRLIRINDALKSETSRRAALVALADIERSIASTKR